MLYVKAAVLVTSNRNACAIVMVLIHVIIAAEGSKGRVGSLWLGQHEGRGVWWRPSARSAGLLRSDGGQLRTVRISWWLQILSYFGNAAICAALHWLRWLADSKGRMTILQGPEYRREEHRFVIPTVDFFRLNKDCATRNRPSDSFGSVTSAFSGTTGLQYFAVLL
jgi:hypothetical protein